MMADPTPSSELFVAALLLAEGTPSPFAGMLPMLLMVAVVYFLLLRPMGRQEKDRKKRIQGIARGDKVVLTGGVLGRVSSIDDQIAVVEIADKVKIRVLRKDLQDLQDNVLKAAGAGERGEKPGKDEREDKADKADKADKGEEVKSTRA
jgi:preprotein translocase subunit YajC